MSDAKKVRDGMEVRLDLVARVKSGEITLEQAQATLRKLRRAAKEAGEATYMDTFSR